jgi:hypothetical protein
MRYTVWQVWFPLYVENIINFLMITGYITDDDDALSKMF